MDIKKSIIKLWNPFYHTTGKFISLNITERDIKVVQLSKKSKSFVIDYTLELKTPALSVIENIIVDGDVISKAIREALDKKSFSTKDVAIGLNSNEVIVKKINIPIMEDKDIIDYAYIEVANHIPYKTEDVFVDYKVIGISEEDKTRMDIFLIVCKKEVVDMYRDILEKAGLNLKYVDCDVFALYNIHKLNMSKLDNEELDKSYRPDISQAFVNIGYSSSSVVVVYENQVKMASSSGFGTKFLDGNIAEEFLDGVVDHDKITEFKKGSSEKYLTCYLDYFDYITGEILVVLNHYNSTNPEFPVEHIHVSGGGILLENSLSEMETRLGVAVSLFNPFNGTIDFRDKNENFDTERNGYRFALCCGLSLRD